MYYDIIYYTFFTTSLLPLAVEKTIIIIHYYQRRTYTQFSVTISTAWVFFFLSFVFWIPQDINKHRFGSVREPFNPR